MFKRNEVSWGIDLGHRSLKAVQLQNSGGGVTAEQFECIEYEEMEVDQDPAERARIIRGALSQFLSRISLKKGDKVAVAIPGRSAFNRTIPLPPVEEKRIPDIVRYEAQQLIPFPIDEVIWDYQRLGSGDEFEEELEVILFAVKTQIIYGFIEIMKAAKVHADVVQVAPLSLYNFVQYDQEPEGSTIVVDLGAGNADLVLIDGDRFWNRPLPYSGDDVTKALQDKFQISFEEAEELKINASDSKQAEKLFSVMRPVLGDIVSEIHRSIGYYKSQARNVRFDRMVLLGNSFKLKGMKEFFAQHLDYSVAVLDHLERVETGPAMDTEAFESQLPSCGVSLGLALQGLNRGPITINILPREEQVRKLVDKKKPYGIGVAAMLGLMVGASYYSNSKTNAELEAAVKEAPAEIKTCKADESKYKSILAKLGPLQADIKKVEPLGAGREYWALIMNELERAVPKEEHWISRIETTSMSVALAARNRSGRGGKAGPARRRRRSSRSRSDGIGMKLVVDILLDRGVGKGDIVASISKEGGIEYNLERVPIFENLSKYVEKKPVKVKVGLLRDKEELRAMKDRLAAIIKKKKKAGLLKKRPDENEKFLDEELELQKLTDEIYSEEQQFLRFTFTWSVPAIKKLQGSVAWWQTVLKMAQDFKDKGEFQSAMSTIYDYQVTSPEFGKDKDIKKEVVNLLVALEPKLKGSDQHDECLDLIERLDRSRLPKPVKSAAKTNK